MLNATSTDFDTPFRVTDLKQWVYCPRILYYHTCLPDIRPTTYKMKAGAHFKLQLAAYAMMLEEMDGSVVHRGFLYFIPLRKAQEIRLDKRIRNKLLVSLEAMQRMIWSEAMPSATPHHKKCVACEFRRFCNDVL